MGKVPSAFARETLGVPVPPAGLGETANGQEQGFAHMEASCLSSGKTALEKPTWALPGPRYPEVSHRLLMVGGVWGSPLPPNLCH